MLIAEQQNDPSLPAFQGSRHGGDSRKSISFHTKSGLGYKRSRKVQDVPCLRPQNEKRQKSSHGDTRTRVVVEKPKMTMWHRNCLRGEGESRVLPRTYHAARRKERYKCWQTASRVVLSFHLMS